MNMNKTNLYIHEANGPKVHNFQNFYISPFMIVLALLQVSLRVWWEKLERKVRYLMEFAKNVIFSCQSFT